MTSRFIHKAKQYWKSPIFSFQFRGGQTSSSSNSRLRVCGKLGFDFFQLEFVCSPSLKVEYYSEPFYVKLRDLPRVTKPDINGAVESKILPKMRATYAVGKIFEQKSKIRIKKNNFWPDRQIDIDENTWGVTRLHRPPTIKQRIPVISAYNTSFCCYFTWSLWCAESDENWLRLRMWHLDLAEALS